jgi:RNA polymerase sigma factor for flagellar operon FliA
MKCDKNTTTGVSSLQEVWGRFHRGDSRCRNTLVEAYLPLVRAAADRMHAKLVGVELDDLVSSGTLGLMHAVQSFDPGREVKFETYCLPRIRGAMLDGLRAMDWVPRLARSRHRRLAQAVLALEATVGRNPTKAEIAAELGVSEGEARRIQGSANLRNCISLERTATFAGDIECRLGDTLESHSEENPAYQSLRRDLMDVIQQDLSRAQRLVILLYYYEGMTLREIGTTLDLSESRVSQMHSGILARFRTKFETQDTSRPAAA